MTLSRPLLLALQACALACLLAVDAEAQTAGGDAVARGAYLARAGDCVSCHTTPGGAPFAGGLRMDTPFGYLLAPNITPDAATGIGSWSADEFYRALHQGVNRRGQDMYPGDAFRLLHTRHTRGQRRDLRLPAQRAPVKNAVRCQPSALSLQPALVDGGVA